MRLPGNFPMGLAALLRRARAIGWIGGFMSAPDVAAAAKDIALALPTLQARPARSTGCSDIAPLLATAIPLGVYNFTEGMTNVESAAAAGDNYNLRSVLLADGTGAVVGSALGSPFPPAVYIGHPGWKEAGGRVGYSMATGVVDRAAVLPRAVRPARRRCCRCPAIVPILLYIGLLIGAQAFQVTPKIHAAAVVAALIPNIASWATGLMDNVARRGRDAAPRRSASENITRRRRRLRGR